MADINMFLIGSPSDLVNPLFAGEVKPEGIELTVTRADGSTGYWRQFNFEEFDVSSLSVASYISPRPKDTMQLRFPYLHRDDSCMPACVTTSTPALKGQKISR